MADISSFNKIKDGVNNNDGLILVGHFTVDFEQVNI